MFVIEQMADIRTLLMVSSLFHDVFEIKLTYEKCN